MLVMSALQWLEWDNQEVNLGYKVTPCLKMTVKRNKEKNRREINSSAKAEGLWVAEEAKAQVPTVTRANVPPCMQSCDMQMGRQVSCKL